MSQPIEAMESLVRSFPPDPVILELGAHNGTDSHWLRRACLGRPLYVAVEPDPRHYEHLAYVPAIKKERCAIASYTGEIVFNLSDSSNGVPCSSSIRRPKMHLEIWPEVRFRRTITVRCMTLDDLTLNYGITHVDLIWADIQGAEKDMVQGGARTLSDTDWLFVESAEVELYEGQATRDEFLAMLPNFELCGEFSDSNILLQRRK